MQSAGEKSGCSGAEEVHPVTGGDQRWAILLRSPLLSHAVSPRHLVSNSCPAPQALLSKPLVGQNPWPRTRKGTSSQVSVLVLGDQNVSALGGETESWAQLKARATFLALIPQEGGRLLGGKLLEHAKLQGSVGITTHSTEVHKKQNHCVMQPGHLEPHSPLWRDPRPPCLGD